MIVVLGHPSITRAGFEPASKYGIRLSGCTGECVMALVLDPFKWGVSGLARYRQSFLWSNKPPLRLKFPGERKKAMYGLIGKMTAVSGQRDALIGSCSKA
jgi:hypothetical protein